LRPILFLVERGSIWILLLTAILFGASVQRVTEIDYSDDVTRFLPEDDAEVTQFWRIGEMFGGLNIAIVGLDTVPAGEDFFTPPRIAMLMELTDLLNQVDGVNSVSSLATSRDSRERTLDNDELETVVEDVIPVVPKDLAEAHEIRARVMGAPHLVGAFISDDARAALILCHLDDRVSALEPARLIRKHLEQYDLAGLGLAPHLGGAPFISEGLARAARDDLLILGPIVAFIILLIVVLSFRSARAAILAILPVCMAIVLTMGLMAALKEPLTLISSSLPIVLLALGSAYPVHVVTHALTAAGERGAWDREAIWIALKRVGPPVLGAGLTTVVGFLSFLAMNLEPMRKFGIFMAVGTAISTAVAVLVVPAALMHIRLRLPANRGRIAAGPVAWLQRANGFVDRHARKALALVLLVAVAGTTGVFFVRTDMSTESYFTRETETVRADRFLEERFGGSLFLQVLVEGNVRDPLVLDEIARMEDFVRELPGVSNVQSVTDVVRIANKTLFGTPLLPRRIEQVASLATLADDDPAVRLLVTPEWDAALIQVRLGGFDADAAEALAAAVRRYIDDELAVTTKAVAWRAATTTPALYAVAFARAARTLELVLYGAHAAESARRDAIARALAEGFAVSTEPPTEPFLAALERQLQRDLIEHELIYLEEGAATLPKVVAAIAAAVAREALAYDTVAQILLTHADADERAEVVQARAAGETDTGFDRAVGNIHRGARDLQDRVLRDALLARVTAVTSDAQPAWDDPVRGPRAREVVLELLDDALFFPAALVADQELSPLRNAQMAASVSGYPVLWAGMNASIRENQVKSVSISVVVILVVLSVLFRSVLTGIAAMLPTTLTLLVAFGLLGLTGTPIDLGSTMISSIAFGVGIDYAIHFIWAYRRRLDEGGRQAGMHALDTAGPSIVVNALEVGLAFGVLAFGTVAPMSRFGLLTGEVMLLAASATLFLLPPLLWRLKVPGSDRVVKP
jgi:uncharacterized protein